MLNIWQSTLIFICVGGLLSLGACTDQTDKPGATSVTHTAAPGSRLVAPAVEFPADREPSWVTSLQPQPATDPVAVADLQRLGLEFTGKHYVEAAIAGDQAAVELFLQAGMFVDTRSLGGQSALMGAAANGHLEIVKLLVQNGADLTLRESRTSELTPLLYAVMGGHSEVAEFLLAEGADPNAFNAHLETPLFVAATQQYVESVRVLLENGAEVDAATLRDTTPLTYAAGYPSLEIVKLLVEAGANVNAVDSSGSTPALVAAGFNQLNNLKYLREHGAETTGVLLIGHAIQHLAARSGNVKIIELVADASLDLDQPDYKTAKTPLLLAVEMRHLEMAHWLLDRGADPYKRCVFGYSAYDLAKRLAQDSTALNPEERAAQDYPAPELAQALVTAMTGDAVSPPPKASDAGQTSPRATAKPQADQPTGAVAAWQNVFQTELTLDPAAVAAVDALEQAEIDGLSLAEARQRLSDAGIVYTATNFVEAAVYDHDNLLRLFLVAGINPDAKAAEGVTAMQAACLRADTEMIELLIEHGADLEARFSSFESPCVHLAAYSHSPEAVQILLDQGVSLEMGDGMGRSALMVLAEQGDLTGCELLLDLGAKLAARDNNGRTPLHWAVRNGHAGLLELLIDRGAELDARDNDGITAVFIAALFGLARSYQILCAAGADLELTPSDGTSILTAAAGAGNREIIADLLQRGFDINHVNPTRGSTAIFAAIEKPDADPQIVRYLVEQGARLDIFDQLTGFCPLTLAAVNGHVEIFKMLIEQGADVHAVNPDGISVLHATILNDNPEMVRILLDLNVDPWVKDNEGKTALDRAVEFNCNLTVPVLREAMGLPAAE